MGFNCGNHGGVCTSLLMPRISQTALVVMIVKKSRSYINHTSRIENECVPTGNNLIISTSFHK